MELNDVLIGITLAQSGLGASRRTDPDYQRIKELESALKGLLEQIDSLEDYKLTRDTEPYKAQACWDDAIRNAQEVLRKSGEAR